MNNKETKLGVLGGGISATILYFPKNFQLLKNLCFFHLPRFSVTFGAIGYIYSTIENQYIKWPLVGCCFGLIDIYNIKNSLKLSTILGTSFGLGYLTYLGISKLVYLQYLHHLNTFKNVDDSNYLEPTSIRQPYSISILEHLSNTTSKELQLKKRLDLINTQLLKINNQLTQLE